GPIILRSLERRLQGPAESGRQHLPGWAGIGPERYVMKPIHLDAQQRQELQRRRHQTHDKRVFERLSAVLWVADGKTRCEVADLLGRSVRQLAEWLRLFRNRGL